MGREGGGICVLELRGRASEDEGGDLDDLGEVSVGLKEFGAAVLEILEDPRLWVRVDAVLTLLPARSRERPDDAAVVGGVGPRTLGDCGSRVDEERFSPDSSREVNWSAMLVLGAVAGEDAVLPSFEGVLMCVAGALPGARKELSRLGRGGGNMALRVSLLPPVVAVSSGIAAGVALSSCEDLREKCGRRLRRFDIFEVVPVSEGGGMVFVSALPSPICCSLFMCSEGTSNMDVGRDRSP